MARTSTSACNAKSGAARRTCTGLPRRSRRTETTRVVAALFGAANCISVLRNDARSRLRAATTPLVAQARASRAGFERVARAFRHANQRAGCDFVRADRALVAPLENRVDELLIVVDAHLRILARKRAGLGVEPVDVAQRGVDARAFRGTDERVASAGLHFMAHAGGARLERLRRVGVERLFAVELVRAGDAGARDREDDG